jgi:hypothetical protein
MAAVLFVRIKSRLETKEFERRLLERRPRFLEVPGLVQKIYGRDGATGDVCGGNSGGSEIQGKKKGAANHSQSPVFTW